MRAPRSSRAALAKPDALAAAASLLAERIRLLSLSKPPRCSAAAPSHSVFRCHYPNMLLIQPWSTEVCPHWSSAHSTWGIHMTAFPVGDNRRPKHHNLLLESSCWKLPALCGTLAALHKRMTKSWEKLQAEQIKGSLLHVQLCIQLLQLVSHGRQQTHSEAACCNIRTKTGHCCWYHSLITPNVSLEQHFL